MTVMMVHDGSETGWEHVITCHVCIYDHICNVVSCNYLYKYVSMTIIL